MESGRCDRWASREDRACPTADADADIARRDVLALRDEGTEESRQIAEDICLERGWDPFAAWTLGVV